MSETDNLDKRIIEIIQTGFPITARPYQEIGRMLDLSEDEIIERVAGLRDRGVVRRIGAVFDSRKLGYVSTLVGSRIDDEVLPDVAATVSTLNEVTHNYQRDHRYNLWFTLIARDKDRLEKILDFIRSQPGVRELVALPSTRVYKLRAVFGESRKND